MMLPVAARRNRVTRRAAFTLLEVLVVVAILVILAGVGVVATTRYLEDARKSRAQLGYFLARSGFFEEAFDVPAADALDG